MTSKGRMIVGSILGDGSKKDEDRNVLDYDISLKRRKTKDFSSLTNSVISCCTRILSTSVKDLLILFEEEVAPPARETQDYARNFLEFCCFRALAVATQDEKYLSNKNFGRLTFDMMVAWESPSSTKNEVEMKDEEYESSAKEEEDFDDTSLFYSDLMPMLVEAENTVGIEAFTRIASSILVVADKITAKSQFEALTSSTSYRLPYAIYDRYLLALERNLQNMRSLTTSTLMSHLPMDQGEIIIELDGISQKVTQHIGSSSLTGRLTLTDHAFYFEASSMLSYHNPIKYDLSADLNHVVRPELTGPLGARIFDKAVQYKTGFLPDPVVLEFPETTGSMRRDYWLAIVNEIICVHGFIRKFQLEDFSQMEALARAILSIIRLQATRECFQILTLNPSNLLTFSSTEDIPGGDLILETLAKDLEAARIDALSKKEQNRGANHQHHHHTIVSNSASGVFHMFGFPTPQDGACLVKSDVSIAETRIGNTTPLEKAVDQSRRYSKQVEVAKATVESVKIEGIGINVTILNELLVPAMTLLSRGRRVLSWEEPFQTLFCFITLSYIIYREWIGYIIPSLIILVVVLIIWMRVSKRAKVYKEVIVSTPGGGVSLEQVVQVQRALSEVQGVIQTINIALLKVRSLVLSSFPRATNMLLVVMSILALALFLVPFKFVALGFHIAVFTSQLKKKTSEGRGGRRMREWWVSIPAFPVRFVDSEKEKKIEESFQI